ncbi:hypothetical protein B0H10DRAFT_2429953 [Mycena sp. CBHHK59/15]|nr:hypothetical protein B0H10DRAFT_2429953 [Mycena sp. CBHHK59/15]
MEGTLNSKRKSPAGNNTSSTKRARRSGGKSRAPDAGGTSGTSTGSGADSTAADGSGGQDAENKGMGVRRRNPHGIAPSDVDEAAKPTQRALQRHIRMAAGLLTADMALEPADNKDAQKRAERLIHDAKVIAQGGDEPGHFGQIAKDISLMPAEHIAFFFATVTRAGLKAFHPDVFGPTHSTYNKLHRHLAVSTFQAITGWYGYTALKVSLTVAQDYHLLCDMYDNFMANNSHKESNTPGSLSRHSSILMLTNVALRRYQEAKSKGYRKPILRLVKVKAVHSDDERIPGGDARKKKGLNICQRMAATQLSPLSFASSMGPF